MNIDPLKINMKDQLERKTLHNCWIKGLDTPAGFVLPLKWNYENNKWKSCKWILNRDQLFLIPGNSPMGLRLPLDSLPEVAKEDEPEKVERSLFEELPELEHFHETILADGMIPITLHPPRQQKIKYQDIRGRKKQPVKAGKKSRRRRRAGNRNLCLK